MAQIDSDDFPRFEEEFFLFFLQAFYIFLVRPIGFRRFLYKGL
jgi:hypothetical protein